MTKSFLNIFGRVAVSDTSETILEVSDNTSISLDGTTYTKMGRTTVGNDADLESIISLFKPVV
jgi:hypothetical protein